MEFSELIKKVKTVSFAEIREDADNYFEAVTSGQETGKLLAILEADFGVAIYPSQEAIPRQAQSAVDALGGIMPGQTLYFYNKQDMVIFAMLWPWQDKEHVTLKISRD